MTNEELQSALDGALARIRELLAARDHWKELAEKQLRAPRLSLTVQQLRDAAAVGDPDNDPERADTPMTIEDGNGFAGPGLYVWYTEYPEEGAIPLFEVPEESPQPPSEREG